MSKKEQLLTLTDQVKTILGIHRLAREDDNILYAYVLNLYGYSKDISWWKVTELVSSQRLPSIESVGRVRRKCQELYPELRPKDPSIRRSKRALMPEYKAYSKITGGSVQ